LEPESPVAYGGLFPSHVDSTGEMRSNLDDAGYKKLYKLPSAWFLKPCLFPVSHPAPALRPNQGTKVGRRVNQHSLNVPRSDGIHRQIPTQPLI
jgi:hypothetical protein